MPRARRRITLRIRPDKHAAIAAAAELAKLTVEAWLLEAVDLALVRGSTR